MINKWAAENTDNKIKEVVESIGPNDFLMLLNVIYFKAKWDLQFDKKDSHEDKFLLDKQGNSSKTIMFMSQTDQFATLFDPSSKQHLLRMKYKDDNLSMVICLPNPNDGFTSHQPLSTNLIKQL